MALTPGMSSFLLDLEERRQGSRGRHNLVVGDYGHLVAGANRCRCGSLGESRMNWSPVVSKRRLVLPVKRFSMASSPVAATVEQLTFVVYQVLMADVLLSSVPLRVWKSSNFIGTVEPPLTPLSMRFIPTGWREARAVVVGANRDLERLGGVVVVDRVGGREVDRQVRGACVEHRAGRGGVHGVAGQDVAVDALEDRVQLRAADTATASTPAGLFHVTCGVALVMVIGDGAVLGCCSCRSA